MVKVERTFPAPESLAKEAGKKRGSYEKPDVVEQLRKDFYDKCYICGMKNLQDPQVEHLLPHKNGKYPERKFDWNNLFWVCGHCNGVKNKKKYEEGILDCCKRDPEQYMDFQLVDNEIRITVKDLEDQEAVRAGELVTEVFSLKNTGMRIYKSAMRLKELNLEMNLLYDNLEKMKKNPNKATLRKLQALLRRESNFAAFKRCYVRRNLQQFPEMLHIIERF